MLKRFVSGSTARAAGEMVGVHRNTAALFFTKIRRLIAECQEQKMSEAFEGSVEIDESYFEDKRKGIRGRGAAGKVAVFGILKGGGSVNAQMIAILWTSRKGANHSQESFSSQLGRISKEKKHGY